MLCFMIACEAKPSPISSRTYVHSESTLQSKSPEQGVDPSDVVKRHPYFSSQPLLISTHAASLLVKGMMHQVQGGEQWDLKFVFNVDGALKAAQDLVAIGAFYLHRADHGVKTSPSTPHYRVATSHLWWAHRGATVQLSTQEWRDLISGRQERWPNGELFQLCLRTRPDPLENLWTESYPELAQALNHARTLGRWPIFKDDEQLLAHLTTHPGAIAIFSVGNLKLRGAPLSQVMIKEAPAPRITLSLYLNSFERIKQLYPGAPPHLFQRLKSQLAAVFDTLSDQERPSAVREWGWEP